MQVSAQEINTLITFVTIVFILIPVGLIFYIKYYYEKKKKLQDEKEQLKVAFETELIKTKYEVQEETLQTIGADLHDNIGQLLSLASLTLKSIELPDQAKVSEKIITATDLTDRSIKEMRHLGKLLQGDQLLKNGLAEAIRYEVDWMEKSGRFDILLKVDEYSERQSTYKNELFLFRIFQEAINNIIKHAYASQIQIALQFRAGFIFMEISDNGKGFHYHQQLAREGMGLSNMQKRIDMIGGTLTIVSSESSGTTITITLPI